MEKYGFKPSVIDPDVHYYLGDGALSPEILMPGGHGWGAFLPSDDLQYKNGLETENCTSYGSLHALVTLGKKKFGASFQNNLAERFTGRVSGTTPQGNDPHKVAESIRNIGVIPEIFLPFDQTISTWAQYYPKIIAYWMWAMAQHWTKTYTFSHQWVFLPMDSPETIKQKMITALQFSPLGASVFAWSQHADGLFYSDQPYQNHWICIYDFNYGISWSCFDSYDMTHKLLDWNMVFGQAKGFSISKNTIVGSINPIAYIPFYLGSLLQ